MTRKRSAAVVALVLALATPVASGSGVAAGALRHGGRTHGSVVRQRGYVLADASTQRNIRCLLCHGGS